MKSISRTILTSVALACALANSHNSDAMLKKAGIFLKEVKRITPPPALLPMSKTSTTIKHFEQLIELGTSMTSPEEKHTHPSLFSHIETSNVFHKTTTLSILEELCGSALNQDKISYELKLIPEGEFSSLVETVLYILVGMNNKIRMNHFLQCPEVEQCLTNNLIEGAANFARQAQKTNSATALDHFLEKKNKLSPKDEMRKEIVDAASYE